MRPNRSSGPSVHGAAAPGAAPRRPAITTPPSRPDGRAGGPGRMLIPIRVGKRPGKPVANRARAAIPTSGPAPGAAVSTVSSPTATGMTHRAARITEVGTRAASRISRPMNRGAGGPRQTAPTGPITPSRRSVTAARARKTRRASRTPSAAAARGHPGGRPRNLGSTTSSDDRKRGVAGRWGSSPSAEPPRGLSERTGSRAAARTPGSPARS